MPASPLHPILARAAALVAMGVMAGAALVALLGTALGSVPPALALEPPAGQTPATPVTPLERRLAQWPDWALPAPLPRPGSGDLLYPDWFLGSWQVSSSDGAQYTVRFVSGPTGVVGDRAFNAAAVGRAVLGDRLRSVANDPDNPNRQIARLQAGSGPPLSLESTVVGRRREQPDRDGLLVDELALQIVRGRGEPTVSRVETLSRFERQGSDRIAVSQWQATYPSPAEGLRAQPRSTSRLTLRLARGGPPGGPAS